MKGSYRLAIAAVCLTLLCGSNASAVYMNVAFTGDNIIGSWYQNGAAPVEQNFYMPNAGNWRVADTAQVDLPHWGDYQLIFEVANSGTGGPGNPAGFLAEVSGPGVSGDLLTDIVWEWAPVDNSEQGPDDFNALTWTPVTSYGRNDANTIWYQNNGNQPVAGISGAAHWVWNHKNFVAEMDSPLYFRGEFVVTPEPGTLAILGLGIAVVGMLRMRRR